MTKNEMIELATKYVSGIPCDGKNPYYPVPIETKTKIQAPKSMVLANTKIHCVYFIAVRKSDGSYQWEFFKID